MKNITELKIGDRINVEHGTGVIIGFERFNDKGMSAPMANTIEYQGEDKYGKYYGRTILKLDEGHTWPLNYTTYAEYPHTIIKLNKDITL